MKRQTTLLLGLLITTQAFAQDKLFVHSLASVYKPQTELGQHISYAVPVYEMLDSLKREVKGVKGEEKKALKRKIAAIKNYDSYHVSLVTEVSLFDSELQALPIDSLLREYDALTTVTAGDYTCRIFGRPAGNKISELVTLVDIYRETELPVPFQKSVSHALYVANIAYKKPVEFIDGVDFAGNKLEDIAYDDVFEMAALELSASFNVTIGEWIGNKEEAKQWKVKRVDRQLGLFAPDGKEIVPPLYDEIKPFIASYQLTENTDKTVIYGFLIKQDNKYGFVNHLGEVVIPPTYAQINQPAFFPNYHVRVELDGLQGVMDLRSGQLIIPIEYPFLLALGPNTFCMNTVDRQQIIVPFDELIDPEVLP